MAMSYLVIVRPSKHLKGVGRHFEDKFLTTLITGILGASHSPKH